MNGLLLLVALFQLMLFVPYVQSLNCSPGSYYAYNPYTSTWVCLQCNKPGFYCVNDNFYPCAAGSYSGSGWVSKCTLCPAGTSSIIEQSQSISNCLPCLSGSFSGAGATACSQCIPGTYSTANSSVSCTACLAGTFSKTVGANSSSTCMACPNILVSEAGAISCVCPAGFQASETACNACPAGTYKSRIGNFTCTPCGANLFSTAIGATNDSVCSTCAANMSFIIGSSGCACEAGFEPNSTSCNQCQPSTYKSATGNFSCTLCPLNTYSIVTGANSSDFCLPCGQNSSSLPGSSFCVCNAGYEPTGSGCSACPIGKFKAQSGNLSCVSCNTNQYSLLGAAECYTCTATASPPSSPVTPYNCPAGQEPNGAFCIPCVAGSYKSSISNTSCVNCDASLYSLPGATVCVNCGSNSVATSGSTTCSCRAGYYPNNGACIACLVNTYKSNIGNDSCANCGANTTTNGTACFCLITHFGNPESGCLPCTNNKTRSQTTSSYTSDADCTVDATNTDSSPTPNPPNNSGAANPLASMMGVSNEIFFAIIGSVGAVILIAFIAGTIVVRKRFQKQKEQLLQANRRGVVSAMGQQNPEAGILAPLMGNAIMPYSTNNRTSNMLSMQRQNSIYPTHAMSTTYTGVTNGTTAHSFGGATLATTGPNWRQ